MLELRCDPSRKIYFSRVSDAILPRKARTPLTIKLPVPETDTGRLVEYTKGRERTLSKELGKLAP